ncbi:MAG: zinc metallopeptidase [Ruminococcaceae bacterium]|nr:zinc metallopeptidase [Oscillospiraceae bacterium]
MFFGFFWGDWTIIVLIPAMIFALWAQTNVQSTFKKYNAVRNSRGLTGADVARRILNENGLQYIRVEHIPGHLNDHFDPKAGVIRLSDAVYNATSAAAIGVAAHEAGHACQHATGYLPIKIRAAIIPATNIGSRLAMPLFILGLIFAGSSQIGYGIGDILMFSGIALFSLSVLFQLVTLPTEFNASSRALKTLESSGMLYGEELAAAGKTLRAAALTYVAALATALASLLRLLLIAGRNRRSN